MVMVEEARKIGLWFMVYHFLQLHHHLLHANDGRKRENGELRKRKRKREVHGEMTNDQ
jgi:hypothetical protein